jgi:hypothetical protein
MLIVLNATVKTRLNTGVDLSWAAIGLRAHAAALALGMLWLFVTQSRTAALILIAIQLFVLVTGAFALRQFDFSLITNRDILFGAVAALFASVFSHAFAIYFLSVFVLRKRTASAGLPAA